MLISIIGTSPFKMLYDRELFDFSFEKILSHEFQNRKSINELDRIRRKYIEFHKAKRSEEMIKAPKGKDPTDLKIGRIVHRILSPHDINLKSNLYGLKIFFRLKRYKKKVAT
ncbi:hypothetical protein DMUE_2946 [Dictyocoela muelleri]|nr:hypothetical protein DMUE_2946 [Dictyocoela muelleri]